MVNDMKVSFEYDLDPRYGWALVDLEESNQGLIIVHTDKGSKGFMYSNGEMTPACICDDRSELKPCPFCGGYNLTSEGVTNKSIFCVDCGAYGPEPAIDTNEVYVDWNTRVEIHKPVLK